MKHKPYLPDSDTGKADWLITFKDELPAYATLLGITTPQMDQVVADAAYFPFLLNLMGTMKDYSQSLTDYKDVIRDGGTDSLGDVPPLPVVGTHTPTGPGIFLRVQSLVRQIKANPAYTETIGEALGIIGDEISVDYDTVKPNPKGTLKNGHAYLTWKNEHTDGAKIWADYNGGTNYQFVARVISNHFLDPHMPESGVAKKFAYVVRLMKNEEVVGVGSDPVFVTVTGQELLP